MGTPLPFPKGGAQPPPNCRPMVIVAKRLDGCRPQHRRLCVRWGPSPPPPKGAEPPPQFLVHFYCGQTDGCIKMPLGTDVGLSPGDFVLDGDPVPSPKRGRSPQISAHVYCGQTVEWIKMALDMEVSLSPADIALDGDPAHSPKRGRSPVPIFSPFLLWPNR